MMSPRGMDCVPVDGDDRGWYFAEDGTLAPATQAGHATRLQEWLGFAYALTALTLGSSAWLTGAGGREDRRESASARSESEALA